MKILILGAGRTGSTVAAALSSEQNDIVVVDKNPDILTELRNRLDIGVVVGNAVHPSILRQANAAEAEMVIAVTDQDEINLLACQIINTLFGITTKIARVRAPDFLNNMALFSNDGIPVDVVISPEQIVMEFIVHLMEHPGASYVSDFADGKVRLLSVVVTNQGLMVNKQIKQVRELLTGLKIRIVAIFRSGNSVVPNGSTVIQRGDEVFFVAPREEIPVIMSVMKTLEPCYKRVIFAGGGHIGKRLARTLEHKYQIKIIEKNLNRVKNIANELEHCTVIYGDSTDQELLLDERIDSTDLFCAVTNDDGINIISATLAKRLGAKKVMCLLNHAAYEKLIDKNIIDISIIPEYTTIGMILKHIRKGDMQQVYSLREGHAEALEVIAHSKQKQSVVGIRVNQVELPEGIVIGALVRDDHILMIHHDTVFQEGDRVVMFLMDKKLIPSVEKLFKLK